MSYEYIREKDNSRNEFLSFTLFDRRLSPWAEDTQHLKSEGSHIWESRALPPSAGAVKARCSLSHSLSSCVFGDHLA